MRVDHVINQFPQCGVGNKLLYYWNLRQAAHVSRHGWNMVHDADIDSLIDVPYPYDTSMLKEVRKQKMVLPFSLGENFFKYEENRVPIDEIFMKKPAMCGDTICTNFSTCRIHLRGGDFRIWKNGEGMLSLDYYWRALQHIIDISDKPLNIEIITDDQNHPHLHGLMFNMSNNKIDCNMPKHNSCIVNDWYSMVDADYIVSSPSTFAITAGMLSNAYITHSKEWVDKRVSENDPFWVGLNNGGNSEYKATLI